MIPCRAALEPAAKRIGEAMSQDEARYTPEPHEAAADAASAIPDDILFLNEYEYTNDLVADFARIETEGRRRVLLVSAVVFLGIAVVSLFTSHATSWVALFAGLAGVFLLWYRANLRYILSRHYVDTVEKNQGALNGRYRRVAVNDGGLMVFGADGRSQYFPFEKLRSVGRNDRIFVAVFDDAGVTVPQGSFIKGTAEEFARFLDEKKHARR